MPGVRVDPEYLDKLAGLLKQAQEKIDAGFNAPRGDIGQYPGKLTTTHGATASSGERAIMNVIDSPRAAVQTELHASIKACTEALQKAKQMYLATDQEHHDVLRRQMDTGH